MKVRHSAHLSSLSLHLRPVLYSRPMRSSRQRVTSRATVRAPSRQGVLAALAIAIAGAAVVAHAPALLGGFVFDDHELVESSALLRGPLWRIWFSTAPSDYWPLTYTSFWAEWRLWGTWAGGYHATNLVLHVAAALLVWALLRRLRVPGAWLAGLLFAIHPVTVESVGWISERKNALSGALVLGSLLAWVRFDDRGDERDYRLAGLLFLLALLAKASVVMVPFALLGLALHRRGRIGARDLARTAHLFAMSLALGAATAWFQWIRFMGNLPYRPRELAERIGGAGWALASYAQKALLPANLAFAYPEWPVSHGSPLFWLPLASLAVAFGLLARSRHRWARAALLALGFHAVMLAPVLGLVDMAWFTVGPVANHLQYVALLGPVALVAAAVAAALERARAPGVARGAVGLAVVALAALTFRRAGALEDDLALWRAAARDAPQSHVAAWKHADALGSAGDRAGALRALDEAAARMRDPARSRELRSVRLLYSGRIDEAMTEAAAARKLRPDPAFDGALTERLGTLLIASGRPDAVDLLAGRVAEEPRDLARRYWLAHALARDGRLADAEEVLRGSSALAPRDPRTRYALAATLAAMGRVGEARVEVAAALGASPSEREIDAALASLLSGSR
jgi:protein O-mannosyl-transferase